MIALVKDPVSVAAAATTKGRWIEVLSHLDPKYGGLSAAVPALAQAIKAEGIQASLSAFCIPGEHTIPPGFHAADSQQLSFWPAGRKAWLLGSQTLLPHFDALLRGAQGVHIHGLWEQSTATAASAARRLKLPYVLSAHGMLEPWALSNRRLKKLLYAALVERNNVAQASCLHALTHTEAQQYRNFGARQPIAVIPNAVSLPEHTTAEVFFSHFPALRGKKIVLFLGRLHRKKGLHVLLEAWSQVSRKNDDAHLVLAGPGSDDLQAELQTMVRERGLQASVTFAGMLRDQAKWSAFAAASGFVLPSHSEGLSVSVLEAMGMGLPVIISRACNMPEVAAFDAGWEIEPAVAPLADALLDLLESRKSRNRERGENGARLIRERYTWPVVAAQMADTYLWLQGGPRPGRTEILTLERGLSR